MEGQCVNWNWITFLCCSFRVPEYVELSKPLVTVVKPQSQTGALKQMAFPEFLPKPIDFIVVTH